MRSQYSTREAAKLIHVALITLQKHVAKKTFPVPPLVTVGGVIVRLWSDADVKRARKALAAIKRGRKPQS
jgi:hypothetical protein